MVVPEVRNGRTSSKTQVLGAVQDSDLTVGPRLIGAPRFGVLLLRGVGGMAQPLNNGPAATNLRGQA